MTKVTLRLDQGYLAVTHAGNHTIIAHDPEEEGGVSLGPSAKELLLAALASCAAITAKMYANRKGWALEGVEIDVTTNRHKTSEFPAYQGDGDFVHEFRQRIVFKGDLTHDQKLRLLEIAGKCPVHRALTEPTFMIEELVDSLIADELTSD